MRRVLVLMSCAVQALAGCAKHEAPPSPPAPLTATSDAAEPAPIVDTTIVEDAAAGGAVDAGDAPDAAEPPVRWHHLSALAKLDGGACSDGPPRTVDVYLEIVPHGGEELLRIRIPRLQVEEDLFAWCGSAGLGCILASRGSSALYYFGTDMSEEWGAVRACGSQLVVRSASSSASGPAKKKRAVYTVPCGAAAVVHVAKERAGGRLHEVGSPVDTSEPACPP